MAEVPISGRKNAGLVVLVDDEDLQLVSEYKWYLSTAGYAFARVYDPDLYLEFGVGGVCVMMHHILLPETEIWGRHSGMVRDHINRNRLDNRRCNLRWVTPQENTANSPPRKGKRYKGVYKNTNGWMAQVSTPDRGFLHLGTFTTEREAALVYDAAVRRCYGDLAYLNYPEEHYTQPIRHFDYVYTPKKTSRYEGVSKHSGKSKNSKSWQANYKGRYLAIYRTEEEAHHAYEQAKQEQEADYENQTSNQS